MFVYYCVRLSKGQRQLARSVEMVDGFSHYGRDPSVLYFRRSDGRAALQRDLDEATRKPSAVSAREVRT